MCQNRWSFALQIAILADMAEQRRSAIIAVNDPANGGIERHPFVIFERSPASSMLFAKLSAVGVNSMGSLLALQSYCARHTHTGSREHDRDRIPHVYADLR